MTFYVSFWVPWRLFIVQYYLWIAPHCLETICLLLTCYHLSALKFFSVFFFTVTGPSSVFPCCGGDPQSTGCTVNSHHITNGVDPRGFVKTLNSSGDKSKAKVYALGTIHKSCQPKDWVGAGWVLGGLKNGYFSSCHNFEVTLYIDRA